MEEEKKKNDKHLATWSPLVGASEWTHYLESW